MSLIVGVLMVVVALAILFDTKRMQKTLKELTASSTAVMFIAIINVVLGVAMLAQEHVLSFDLIGLYALVGWLMFLRGTFVLWFPGELMKVAKNKLRSTGFLMFLGLVHLALGGGLVYFGYTMM